jgi:hypothetical protein
MKTPIHKIYIYSLLMLMCFLFVSLTAQASETIDVYLSNNQITAQRKTVNHDDFLNICSRDNDFHQPYSTSQYNKFGSSTAKEKDILKKNHCRIVKVKNTSDATVEMVIYDRFNPKASLVLNVTPKPHASKKEPQSDLPAGQVKTFSSPKLNKYQLDWCYAKNEGCGEKAAVSWCATKGFHKATKWEKQDNTGTHGVVTKKIGTGELCPDSMCSSFKTISCTN